MIDKNVSLEHKKVLITGVAGFIGANLAVSLLRTVDNIQIIGIDNLNDYYDVSLKEYRLKQIISEAGKTSGTFTFIKGDIAEKETVFGLFQQYCPDIVVNLAAQAGVRYSIINPDAYIKSNLIGFYHIKIPLNCEILNNSAVLLCLIWFCICRVLLALIHIFD